MTDSASRSTPRRDAAINRWRAAIVRGDFAPGAQLPNRKVMARRLQVSYMTVQRATDQLVAEGFLSVDGRQGTYVRQHPPHRYRYGLVFPQPAHDLNLYGIRLKEQADTLAATTHWQFALYGGIDWERDLHHVDRLVADVRERRLAGLIFAFPPAGLQRSAAWPLLDCPKVYISGIPGHEAYSMPLIHLDYVALLRRFREMLQDSGCRRPGILYHPGATGERLAQWLVEAGLGCPDNRQFPVTPALVPKLLPLLFDQRLTDRPDSLLVLDDHLVESVAGTLPLLAGGPRLVVAHANFPLPSPTPRIRRLGWHAGDLLRLAIDLLDAQRDGRRVPGTTAARLNGHVHSCHTPATEERIV